MDIHNTTSYNTLTESEWNSILSRTNEHFYISIIATQTTNGLTTGPYQSTYEEVYIPFRKTLTTDETTAGTIAAEGQFSWYKFVAPTSGIYTFYTEGDTNTIGELFSKPTYGTGITNRLVINDDAGTNINFSVT